MLPTTIDLDDINEGVDRKQLNLVKQRFIELNQQRYQRTCAALSDRQKQFLQLLPLLFHVNHAMLPGYHSHQTPCGISNYKPDKDELRLAKGLARSFKYNRDLISSAPAIEAIFVMGSVGTIAHSDSSDLDIWICHSTDLSADELAELNSKCHKLHRWAEQSIHLEAHFFLMESQRFREGKISKLSSEDSGSAQHYLLLDEFYRTALWLAGKVPLWWFVPAKREGDYDNFSAALLNKRFIRTSEVIDFGGIPSIPPNEFVGAGIWQVYKGIEGPYKSVLKLLLLETYASDAASEPLALTLKRAIYQDTPNANELDPYVMIYRRLANYLRNQEQRLELMRRCLYFKVNKPLTRASRSPQKSWQRLLLESLTQEWGWQKHHLHLLDDRPSWKAPQVIAERRLLVDELSNSYRLLTDIDKNTFARAAISNEELMILGRKLHAAFERKAGKIEWINPGISKDLHEPWLCAVYDQEDSTKPWKIFRGSAVEFAQRQHALLPIKRTGNLVELLLWCHRNGILTSDSKLDIVDEKFQLTTAQRQQLLQCLYHWLALPLPAVAHEQFKHSAQPSRLLMLFNVGVEPQAELHKKGMQMLSSQRDALGYSGFRENLVLTADVIQMNSWQEIVCRHYGTDAMINSLLHYLRMLPPGRGMVLPEVTIRCFSIGQGNIISQRLEELWRDIIACYYSGTRPGNTRYILEMGEEYLLLQFLQQQPHITRYKTYEKLLEKLANAQMDYSPIVIDRYGLRDKPLKLFTHHHGAGGIAVFYHFPTSSFSPDECASLSILDEKGSLFTIETPYRHQQTLLRPLHKFIRHSIQHQQPPSKAGSKQIPIESVDFFELLGNIKQHQGYTEPRNISTDVSQLAFVDLHVIAEPDDEGKIQFTFACEKKTFCSRDYGQTFFDAVARYLVKQHLKSEHYPCYITDLNLNQCRDLIAPQTGLQLMHYLQIKVDLERKLNEALARI